MKFSRSIRHNLSKGQMGQRKLQKGAFPNQISLGSFTPHSTLIEVACFNTDLVATSIRERNLLPVRRDFQVLCHEMTHWLDFFGTVWGREYITAICNSYIAVEQDSERGFPSIMNLYDLDRRVLLPSYYKYSSKPAQPHGVRHPWSIEFSTGVEIGPYGELREDLPMFMIKFGENPSGKNFARQPVSIGALLEVRAIASEFSAAMLSTEVCKDRDAAKVERTMMSDEFIAMIYNHELIEYTSVMHMLSFQSGVKDFFLSARLASSLAYIALNLTDAGFKRISIPPSFKNFEKRTDALIDNKDRGFALACLIFNGGMYNGDETSYIENCVSSSNLGSVKEVLEQAAEVLESGIYFSGKNFAITHFEREASKANVILKTVSSLPQHTLTLHTILGELREICPPFLDSLGNALELSRGRILEYQPDAIHDASDKLRSYTNNLLVGCRGF